MDNKDRILDTLYKKLGDVPTLVAEAIAIREALRVTADRNMDNILLESDWQIVISSIEGLMKVLCLIINM